MTPEEMKRHLAVSLWNFLTDLSWDDCGDTNENLYRQLAENGFYWSGSYWRNSALDSAENQDYHAE